MEVNIEVFKSCLKEQKYRESSIHSYLNCMKQLQTFFEKYKIEDITIELISNHVDWLIEDKEISHSYHKQILTAIQKYFDLVLNKQIDLSDINPKHQDFQLPNCISKSQIKLMIDKTTNLKHKVIICLLYSAGLRLNELLSLNVKDIDCAKKVIRIYHENDNTERIVMLSPILIDLLPRYYEKYKPTNLILDGQGGKTYTGKSVQLVVKQAALRSGINIHVTPQCLRHSFASHLLESGTDIHHVKELLGHQSIKTTENYTHTSNIEKTNIKSPLDLL